MTTLLAAPVEVAQDVYRIASELDGRPLYQFLLLGEKALLVDTGIASTVAGSILPSLARLHVRLQDLDFVVVTHADTDHQGGSAAIKNGAPRCVLTCGLADRELVEDPERLVRTRYRAYEVDHGIAYPPGTLDWVLGQTGAAQAVDICFTGGETIRLAHDWLVRIVATPGHSRGHVAVHDLRANALLSGDAVHGRYYPGLTGEPHMPPNYVDVAAYLETISTLETLAPDSLHGAHWPPFEGEEVGRFLRDSRDFVLEAEERIRTTLAASGKPLTLRELMSQCDTEWPNEDVGLAYALDAHMNHLLRMGAADVMSIEPGECLRYSPRGGWGA